MKSSEVRDAFLAFFKEKNHPVFPSDTLVPKDDPTLLFTSAGMNQFKPYFLGVKKDVRRAASVQKCLRTGDLENVGRTSSHHTFFEMLGNFSFGDYFKKEAIEFAWEFLTKRLNISPRLLWISVYKDDDEAYRLWKDHIGVPGSTIVKLGDEDNFWPANVIQNGPNGPCGPCSEIYYDKGPQQKCPDPGHCNPACSCKRFVEVWNLVFTQYNRVDGKLEPLPSRNIDTGMGLERLCSVLQGVDSNFKTDVFAPILQKCRQILKKKEDSPALYVIADHIRAIFFSISDGVLPSNEDRGYVIRKLIRRAFWTGHALADINKPFLYTIIPALKESMGFYKDNFTHMEDVEKIIFSEEEKFLATMDVGKKMLFEKIEETRQRKKTVLDGHVVFKLYDTYGFPPDLTQRIAEDAQLGIDKAGFDACMLQQKEISKKSSKFDEGIFVKTVDTKGLTTAFIGYAHDSAAAKVIGLISQDHLFPQIHEGQRAGVILDQSVFYPESGGQVHDTGRIQSPSGVFQVERVQKLNTCIVCIGTVIQGTFTENSPVECAVDLKRRSALKRAHSSTHLLQAALRKCLGPHIKQQGSLVEEDRLRFDFNHFTKVSPEELQAIERTVNEYIFSGDPVHIQEMNFKEAQAKNALAFFEEKYEDRVRVVAVQDHSVELCGGLHLKNTSEAGVFKIISESSISSGIRRIEALCGIEAYRAFAADARVCEELIGVLKSTRKDVIESAGKYLARIKELERAVQEKESALLGFKIRELLPRKQSFGQVQLFIHRVQEGQRMHQLYSETVHAQQRTQPLTVFLFTEADGQVQYFCTANPGALSRGFSCGAFLDRIFAVYPGKGSKKNDISRGVLHVSSVSEPEIARIAEEYCDAIDKK